jgi:hypothetical protein
MVQPVLVLALAFSPALEKAVKKVVIADVVLGYSFCHFYSPFLRVFSIDMLYNNHPLKILKANFVQTFGQTVYICIQSFFAPQFVQKPVDGAFKAAGFVHIMQLYR